MFSPDISPGRLADELARTIPAGVGSRERIHLSPEQMDDMLRGGALWAVEQGYGLDADLARTEEQGQMYGADPGAVSERVKQW